MKTTFMMTMVFAMSACSTSLGQAARNNGDTKKLETTKHDFESSNLEQNHEPVKPEIAVAQEREAELSPIVSEDGFGGKYSEKWTFFNVLTFVAIFGAVGFAAWKLLPRKESIKFEDHTS